VRAPVYRNIESKTSFLGIGLQEALFVMSVCLVLLMVMRRHEMNAVGITALLYAVLRLVNSGRAPSFAQHWFAFHVRRWLGGGFFSAAARSRAPRFAYAIYESRDVQPSEPFRGTLAR
jgi:uncharacterized membrane protein YjdF